jgi:hypothetical protein
MLVRLDSGFRCVYVLQGARIRSLQQLANADRGSYKVSMAVQRLGVTG